MDPISIGIIVTVLSLGTVLLFLFNVDFAKSKTSAKRAKSITISGSETGNTIINSNKKSKNNSNSNKYNNTSNLYSNGILKDKQNSNKNNTNAIKKSPHQIGEIEKEVKQQQQQQQQQPNNQNIPDLIVGHESKHLNNNNNNNNQSIQQQHQSVMLTSNGTNKMVKKQNKDMKSAAAAAAKLVTISADIPELEPSLDELDSSIGCMETLLKHSNARRHNNSKSSVARRQSSLFEDDNLIDNMRGIGGSTTPSYSSEQLFTMIAASNLSKDEVELAIEMLLNKTDSQVGNLTGDWKKPKIDPIERLKNQLRDNESVLSVEIQNHAQSRARLAELKNQLQNEQKLSGKSGEELAKLKKELSIANLALEQSRADLTRLQSVIKQREEANSQLISRLEQEKMQLQTILAASSEESTKTTATTTNGNQNDYETLRVKFDEKSIQLQRYELNKQQMNERIGELEQKLRLSDHLVDELRANKQHDDYEASAKISELKSDRIQLEKGLKDQLTRFKELSEANNLLANTINELKLINTRQDEMLKQMTDERQIHDISMKRTLHEMELELKELQQKLNASSIPPSKQHSSSLQGESNNQSAAATVAGDNGREREQKLISEMNQLRDALADLFPDASVQQSDCSNDWVQDYLIALKQLSKTLDELKEPNNNNSESPSPKKSPTSTVNKSTLTPRKNSPIIGGSNGRSSRASTYHGNRNEDKKLQETKLLEALALFCLRCLD